MEPRSAQTMVATAGFLKVTLSAISSSARRSRRHAAHQRFPLAAIHLARLPLGLALGCARTTYHRQLRSMHQKRPWPESHFVIPACLRTDIHLLPVFECGNFCDGSGPPEWEAGPLGEHKCSQLLHTRTAGNGREEQLARGARERLKQPPLRCFNNNGHA